MVPGRVSIRPRVTTSQAKQSPTTTSSRRIACSRSISAPPSSEMTRKDEVMIVGPSTSPPTRAPIEKAIRPARA